MSFHAADWMFNKLSFRHTLKFKNLVLVVKNQTGYAQTQNIFLNTLLQSGIIQCKNDHGYLTLNIYMFMYIIKVSFDFKMIKLEQFDVEQHVCSWKKNHHSCFNWYSCNLIAF